MNNINIAYCTDSNYLEHVAVSITSVILNNMYNSIHFHVFLYDVSTEEQQKLQSISQQITIYNISKNELEKYSDSLNKKITHINRSMYIRLSVPRLLQGIVDKFIYLDADTLCFSDISKILNINIDSVVCAVTPDSLNKENMLKNQKRLSLTSQSYFNSGFLYINVSNWLKTDTENKANRILLSSENRNLIYPDQDALNLVLQNQVLLIEPKWNYLFTWMNDNQKDTSFISLGQGRCGIKNTLDLRRTFIIFINTLPHGQAPLLRVINIKCGLMITVFMQNLSLEISNFSKV